MWGLPRQAANTCKEDRKCEGVSGCSCWLIATRDKAPVVMSCYCIELVYTRGGWQLASLLPNWIPKAFFLANLLMQILPAIPCPTKLYDRGPLEGWAFSHWKVVLVFCI